MSHIIRSFRGFTWALIAAVLAVAIAPGVGQAQEAPGAQLEILGADYDHASGTLHVQLRADGARDQAVEDLTVLVDSVPRSILPTEAEEATARTVLLAIDVSGSMVGGPMASASEAGASLVDRKSTRLNSSH